MTKTNETKSIRNRYDFAVIFDVTDGNPNGDPDSGNMPRIDNTTGHGLITDVCIKRKIRNYVQLKELDPNHFDIYVKQGSVLGDAHREAFNSLGISGGGNPITENISNKDAEFLTSIDFNSIEGVSIDNIDENSSSITLDTSIDITEIKEFMKQINEKNIKNTINAIIKKIEKEKKKDPTTEQIELGREYMCNKFYDIRTFGGVLTTKSAPNCGQVRGPVQLTFARSVDPIEIAEHTITRCASTKETENKPNQTMGNKYTVPYALYVQYGYISPSFADKTNFNDDDLNLLFESIENMFEHDHSASRGNMIVRKIIIFKHNSCLGNTPSHKLFNKISISKSNPNSSTPPRKFEDYIISIDKNVPDSISIIEI